MKKITNLKGVKTLDRNEQKSIFGGFNENNIPIPCGGNCGGGGGGSGGGSRLL